jgi:PPOX class probable F420-dependent enzyme
MPAGYGINPEPSETMLPWDDLRQQLAAARNYWVASTRADGRPHVAPVWGLWLDEAFLFSTDPDSAKGRNLSRQPEVAVHLESGDDVVILEGRLEQGIDQATFARFADAYDAKYSFRPEPDTAPMVYTLRPRRVLAWREKDFPQSATRLSF